MNVKTCAVLICDEDNENPVTPQMEVGKNTNVSIVDQHTYVPRCGNLEDCSWGAHIAKVLGQGKSTRRQDGRDPNRLAP